MKYFFVIWAIAFICFNSVGQPMAFKYKKLPARSGFKMDGYWIWGGSMIKVNSVYHLFASRWPKVGAFPEGYRNNSEIVRAISKSPLGPFKFQEVVIGERDSSCWDANMAHNPTIQKIGDKYVLFYIGSDFTTFHESSDMLLRRIGYAESQSICGPWTRSDKPLIEMESNNPSVIIEDSTVKMVFRDKQLRVFLAEADNYNGPFVIKNENVWPDCNLEDFCFFKARNEYHIVCEDNVGGVSGYERWGIHLFSEDGINDWKKYDPVVVYNHDILFKNDSILHCVRRERPQLLIKHRKITHLLNGVYDGTDSWCQPVKLTNPIRIK